MTIPGSGCWWFRSARVSMNFHDTPVFLMPNIAMRQHLKRTGPWFSGEHHEIRRPNLEKKTAHSQQFGTCLTHILAGKANANSYSCFGR